MCVRLFLVCVVQPHENLRASGVRADPARRLAEDGGNTRGESLVPEGEVFCLPWLGRHPLLVGVLPKVCLGKSRNSSDPESTAGKTSVACGVRSEGRSLCVEQT